MKLIIDSTSTPSGTSFHLQIRGFSIEARHMLGERLTVIDDSGRISVEILHSQEVVTFDAASETFPDSIPEEEKSEIFDEEVEEALSVTEKTDGAVVSDFPSNILFQKLAALRRDIAKEANLPPYIIFHDTTLKDMVSKLPVDLDGMKEVSGVGRAKLEKYGIKFISVIKEYLAESA